MEAFESFDHAGFVCELHMDEDAESPAGWDRLGTLVAFPRMAREWSYPERESTGTEDEALERGRFALVARYLRFTEGAIAITGRMAPGSSWPTTTTIRPGFS